MYDSNPQHGPLLLGEFPLRGQNLASCHTEKQPPMSSLRFASKMVQVYERHLKFHTLIKGNGILMCLHKRFALTSATLTSATLDEK